MSGIVILIPGIVNVDVDAMHHGSWSQQHAFVPLLAFDKPKTGDHS
jgi:hypothetical protein